MLRPCHLLVLAFLFLIGAADAQTVTRGGDPSVAFEFRSPNPEENGLHSRALAGVRDLNSDGVPDLLAGARREDGGATDAGRVYLHSGTDGALLQTYTSPNAEDFGFFGQAVASTEGNFTDIIVGAPNETVGSVDGAGRAYIFPATTTTPVFTLSSPNPTEEGDFGRAVAGVGDVDDDGFDDYLIGAPGEGTGGRVYLFSGSTGTVLDTFTSPNATNNGDFGYALAVAAPSSGQDPVFLIGAPGEGGGRAYLMSFDSSSFTGLDLPDTDTFSYGQSVAWLGDVTGDGLQDFAVGAVPGAIFQARVYVYSGANEALLYQLESPGAQGESPSFGSALAGAGDFDGDGTPDVVVGAPSEIVGMTDAGRAYVFAGDDGALLADYESLFPESFGLFGIAVASTGDVTGDGRSDVVIGAPGERIMTFDGAGIASVRQWVTTTATEPGSAPVVFRLDPPSPNPSSGQATFRYTLSEPGVVRLVLYDLLGREVAVLVDREQSVGSHEVAFAAGALASGVYVVRLRAGAQQATQQLTLR